MGTRSRGRSRLHGAIAGVVLVTALHGVRWPDRAAAAPDDPVRIMVQGDSLSHGSTGDLTWRWFLARHLGASIDLVGPKKAPYGGGDPSLNIPGKYVDPRFDSDHASTWGDSFALARPYEADTFAAQPDVVVLQLGVNDLSLLGASPSQVAELARQRIEKLRALVPGVDVVLCDITLLDRPLARSYNALLPQLAAQLNTPTERVVLAQLSRGWMPGKPLTRGQATTPGYSYDQLHPNSQGQQHIAAAVADALVKVGVGRPYPRPLERVSEPSLPWGSVKAKGAKASVVVRWRRPAGTTSVDLWRRANGSKWTRVAKAAQATRWRKSRLRACSREEFRLRPRRGWTLQDRWSPIVRTITGPSVSQRPKTRLMPSSHGATVHWTAPKGTCFVVIRWKWRTPQGNTESLVVRRPRAAKQLRIGSLRPGTKVSAVVETHGGQDSKTASRVHRTTVGRR